MKMAHSSDCSLHNAPAMNPGPCDCGVLTDEEVERAAFWIEEIMRHMRPCGDAIQCDAAAVARVLIAIERGGKNAYG